MPLGFWGFSPAYLSVEIAEMAECKKALFNSIWNYTNHWSWYFPTFSSFVASCLSKKPVMSIPSFSARYSWLVSSSLARANLLLVSWYCPSDCSVTCNLSSHRTAFALAFSTSDSLSAFDSCFPSFFPFLRQVQSLYPTCQKCTLAKKVYRCAHSPGFRPLYFGDFLLRHIYCL